MDWKQFLLSKRNIGLIVTAICLVLSHHGIIVPDSVKTESVDELIVILSGVWTLITKYIDLRAASKAAIQ